MYPNPTKNKQQQIFRIFFPPLFPDVYDVDFLPFGACYVFVFVCLFRSTLWNWMSWMLRSFWSWNPPGPSVQHRNIENKPSFHSSKGRVLSVLDLPAQSFLFFFFNNLYIIYISTFLTSIFEGQPLQTRPFPTKTRVIWVLGLYICLFIESLRITSKPLIPGFQSLVVQCTSLAVVAT